MTTEQGFYFVDSQTKARQQQFKENAILLQGQAQQIASGIARLFEKKARFLGLDKLYPDLFGKKKKIDISHMTPEEIQKANVQAWKAFLGVK